VHRVLVIDDRAAGDDTLARALGDSGLDVTTDRNEQVSTLAAIVVAVDGESDTGLPEIATADRYRELPVIAVAPGAGPRVVLQLAVDGAVRCVDSADASVAAAAIEVACAPEAPPVAEQRRKARVAALQALARSESPGGATAGPDPVRVRLTRLEHIPLPSLPRVAEPPAWLERCSPKQRELLDVVRRAGSVSKAAHVLGTSRSSVYAGLRRIAHRLRLRDSSDVLRLLGALPVDDPA